MKIRLSSLLLALCLLGAAAAAGLAAYHRTHKLWLPAEEGETLPGVILSAKEPVCEAGARLLYFNLYNGSEQTLSYAVSTSSSDSAAVSYPPGDVVFLTLEKRVDGQWSRWDVADAYRKEKSYALVERSRSPGQSDGPFAVYPLLILGALDAGEYRAVLCFTAAAEGEEPSGPRQPYRTYAEFSVT